uniref:Uncharacterized protein n=1 Tax=Anguilla anguilla TaxID=7936 RepID=A0A0E9TAN6_ANGAN
MEGWGGGGMGAGFRVSQYLHPVTLLHPTTHRAHSERN